MEHWRPIRPNVLHLHQREPVPQQWYRLPDSHAYCHANGDANTDFNAYSYGHVYSYADGHAHSDCNANSDCYSYVYADGYSYSDGDANTDGNADSDSHGHVHADGHSDSNSDSNSDLNAYSDRGEANTDAAAASNNTSTASIVDSDKSNT